MANAEVKPIPKAPEFKLPDGTIDRKAVMGYSLEVSDWVEQILSTCTDRKVRAKLEKAKSLFTEAVASVIESTTPAATPSGGAAAAGGATTTVTATTTNEAPTKGPPKA